jgi:hypothetical protein
MNEHHQSEIANTESVAERMSCRHQNESRLLVPDVEQAKAALALALELLMPTKNVTSLILSH